MKYISRILVICACVLVVHAVRAEEQVSVSLTSSTFPIRGKWVVGEKSGSFDAQAPFKVPAGDVTFMVGQDHSAVFNLGFAGHFTQPFELFVEGRGRTPAFLTKCKIGLKPDEKVIMRLGQPLPPWNAVMIRIKRTWVLVTLERPSPEHDLNKLKAGEWDRKEELPNTMLFWARDGNSEMATELAQAYVKDRNNFQRGLRHTSIMVKGPLDITENDLAKELTEAFALLRTQATPNGQTVEQLITEAKGLLKEVPKK